MIHLVAEELWDWSADLDRIADIDETFRLTSGRGDEVRTDPGDRRVAVPEANATRHRVEQGSAGEARLRPQPHRPRPAQDSHP